MLLIRTGESSKMSMISIAFGATSNLRLLPYAT
nr:MAG TPA: hypothetical protein [Caudoviricetes sp.]